jgi:YVTN family beta-propeller protein
VKRVSIPVLLLFAMLMTACGSSGNSGGTTTGTSGLHNRAFVTNWFSSGVFSGILNIVNASNDVPSAASVAVLSQPTIMAVTPDRALTLIFDSGVNSISVINNGSESLKGTITAFPGFTESMVAKDASTGYAAVPNAVVAGQSGQPAPPLGAVAVLDLNAFAAVNCSVQPLARCIPVPRARWIVMNHAGTRLLVFSDNSNSVTIIDTSTNSVLATVSAGFDRPVSAVFTNDDRTAYVMNCGAECGGSQSGVAVLDMSAAPPQVAATLNFANGLGATTAGATVGFLNGNTLYVAGTIAGIPGNGTLVAVSVNGTATPVIAAAPWNISDGFHTHMALASNNKLFIGSKNCTNDPSSPAPTGCVTIFDVSQNSASIDTARDLFLCPDPGPCAASKGSVTGMAAVPNRNVVYVVEGNVFRVFDTTTSSEIVNRTTINGHTWDVKLVDQ